MNRTGAPERYATCDGRPLIVSWTIGHHFFQTFEVPTDDAEALVPDALLVVEARPGVALLSVGVLRFRPGQFAPDTPPFNEVYAAVHVAPDLSLEMPAPVMAMSTFAVLSDSAEFVAREDDTLYAPARHSPGLAVQVSDDGLGVEVRDGDGPILAMPSDHPEPRWVTKEMWGQHFTDTRGLHHGIWEWDGEVHDHMRPGRGWRLFPHPFWAGLDPARVGRCYRRMVMRPGTVANERFWAMRPVGTRA